MGIDSLYINFSTLQQEMGCQPDVAVLYNDFWSNFCVLIVQNEDEWHSKNEEIDDWDVETLMKSWFYIRDWLQLSTQNVQHLVECRVGGSRIDVNASSDCY